MRHTYLVCYDISDDVRRSRVLKTMKGFGDHLQYSVFECVPVERDRPRALPPRPVPGHPPQ